MSRPPCIQVEDLHYLYNGEVLALEGISLTIDDNDLVAVIGQNGSGKTTLVKHFNGLLKPTRGRVLINGADTRHHTVGELARTVGYVFQNPDYQIFCSTTREELSFGPRNLGLSETEIQERTEEALAYFGLEPFADRPPAILGFGLRRKVSIAAVYAMRPRIFVLDEPTTGLDWKATMDLMALIGRLHREGHTIILVTHDMRIVAEHARKSLVLQRGKVLAYGLTRDIFRQAELLRSTQIEPPQITVLARQLAPQGFPDNILTVDEFCRAYERRVRTRP